MLKAVHKQIQSSLIPESEILAEVDSLKKEFSLNGTFQLFKHTNSYIEIPPLTKTIDAGTYIKREYQGVKLVTMGASIYFEECDELQKYLKTKPRYLILGGCLKKVILAEDCYKYLTDEGKEFQQTMLKKWYRLVKPHFNSVQ